MLLASIKLIKVKSLPGSKLIFIAVIGYVLSGFFLPESDAELGEESMFLQLLTLGINSLLMLVAAYGFYSLANHISNISANKSLNQDAR